MHTTTPSIPRAGSIPPDNPHVLKFVREVTELVLPDEVFWCDGSDTEKDLLYERALKAGVLEPLDESKWPGCYFHRSNPNDVARVEQLTLICTPTEAEAGPSNHWEEPGQAKLRLRSLLAGGMRGRTLYVIPYLMGPPGSPMSKAGIQVTDSIYVVLNMRIMSRMGEVAYAHLNGSGDFNQGIHALLDCNPDRRWIAHFPQDNTIISVGSGYGGNALLGKKCMALRTASYIGKQEGWMAEHMLLLRVESPEGEIAHVAAAFPSACGKTNFAMLIPPAEMRGWKVRTIGDDIAWMRPGPCGRLRAINPESGYFGVAPGTGESSNPNAMRTIVRDTIFTNVGITTDGDVWWEGKDDAPPPNLLDWRGEPWLPGCGRPCAHPNSRFTAPMRNNPALSTAAEDPDGVPVDAIIFGGRRADTVPLVFESFDWEHGVYLGASVGSEMTAAAAGTLGKVRRDPMAMLPFCGYHMGDYFGHWLEMGKRVAKPPKIFHVNWFRKDENGKFLWPGFGDNMRALEWIVRRCRGSAGAKKTPLGFAPGREELNLNGLESAMDEDRFAALQRIDSNEWWRELESQDAFFAKFEGRMPEALLAQKRALEKRMSAETAETTRRAG